MKSQNNPFKNEPFLKYNSSAKDKIFKVRKELKGNIFSLEQAAQEPSPPQAGSQEASSQEPGYLAVSVFTASGALPLAGVLITVYAFDENDKEVEIVHHVSDLNGQVPLFTLPVTYNSLDPFESNEYYFSTYSLRAQAINYYTVNIIDLRVFPNTITYFQIDMIPIAAGPIQGPEQTFVIPPSPIDISND